ncbi:KTSC domain-containing protein [Streptosporangium sp. NPDC023825]|uniref:KTSC domain-containing protein n=1 Tax=Streptosporangium sp. NPDC023825 TaxID=3154909 RepID=UPI003424055D
MPRPRRPNRRSVPSQNSGRARATPYDAELLGGGRQSSGSAYDDVVLGGSDGRPGYDTPLERQYRRQYRHLAPGADRTLIPTRGERLRVELQRDRALPWGNDANLVPHSTLDQTSDPNRPRTVAMGYNHQARELRIKFRDGARYVYYGVPPDVWEEILGADSVGKYMNDHIVHSYMYDQETFNRR